MKLKLFFFFLIPIWAYGQDAPTSFREKKVPYNDTIMIDSVSINPNFFELKTNQGKLIDPLNYKVNYKEGILYLNQNFKPGEDTLTISYLRYPLFLTKKYFQFDTNIITENSSSIDKLYALERRNNLQKTTPFGGLTTQGSITRGVTVGNNQNAVVNSELDLQIIGKLSENVSIRASLQDANIPSQQGGYSQGLDEFDQIFIELYGDQWNIRAGDVDLINSNSYFGRFTKKIQGISLQGTLNHNNGSNSQAFLAAGLVRGVFQRSEFIAQEGNQGPYRLTGPNGELFILIVSGSERVYINGVLLNRGENADYVIDYNAGEIRFNPTYTITANMRITVEYQFTERSFTRFIGYGGGTYNSDKLSISAFAYSENDAKNQPLQQNLTEEQVSILANAGDNNNLMNAPSAVEDTFSENKILYKKEIVNGTEIFVFSNNPEDTLFNVRFSLVGANNGDYIISNESAITRIFEYIPPVNGISQGNYAPTVRLNAPEKLQLAGVQGTYNPSEKTQISFETVGSVKDLNLFSNIDDGDNDGFAGRLSVIQEVFKIKDSIKVKLLGAIDYLDDDFNSIERLFNIEFNRDWNIENPTGNQTFSTLGTSINIPNKGIANYQWEQLQYGNNFKGNRHTTQVNFNLNRITISHLGSVLNSNSTTNNANFIRTYNNAIYNFKNTNLWVGGKFHFEKNKVRELQNDSLTLLSQGFKYYETYIGKGDSTKVFGAIGYRYRVNDSVRNNTLTTVNTSNDFFIKSRLIANDKANLALFSNYRIIDFKDPDITDEKNLNVRLLYAQSLWKGMVRFNTALETNNGVIPQQEFTYVKVDQGQGNFTWIDYNNNGIQELNEFEIAQFQDQGEYVRVLLPNQNFLRIKNNKFSQIVTLNPQEWSQEKGLKKVLSKFYNQTSYVIDKKIRRTNNLFDILPFQTEEENPLGLTLNFKNTLFFNRGKQRYTTGYTYISNATNNLISLGLQETSLKNHQLNFTHQFLEVWVANFKTGFGTNQSLSENFENRNFSLENTFIGPKISYLLNKQTRFDFFYEYKQEENTIAGNETLLQQKIGVNFAYNNIEKISLSGAFNFINNDFSGSVFSPVAYTMLEGLQAGENFTWNVLFQKRISTFLDANISYFGRKSENSPTIHTGSVQLRAFF